MAKVGDQAHTAHGLGKITEEIKERGKKSYRVAGKGFSVWVPEAQVRVANENLFSYMPFADEYQTPEHQELAYLGGLESTIIPGDPYTVNEKNHTTLPWSGKNPQHPVDIFRHQQTILPGEYTNDPDDILHPSDSVSGASRAKPSGPQPNPDLFLPNDDHPFADQRTSSFYDHTQSDDHEGDYLNGEGHDEENYFQRPAGLSDRYAYVQPETKPFNPRQAFRNDPQGFIRTCGHLWTDGDDSLTAKYADYTDILESNTKEGQRLFEAAWSDVRQKAQRLRHEGKVAVNELGSNAIYATVEGDNGIYDVMLSKTGGQSVGDWACSCEWGRWAFKRKFSYVGRLCSHAYAAYLHMQSDYMKNNPQHFYPKSAALVDDFKKFLTDNHQAPEAASVATYLNTLGNNEDPDEVKKLYDYVSKNYDEVPERDFKIPYTNDPDEAYKTADLLRTKPNSLTPNLRNVPKGETQEWMDVTKDDRETTDPDSIVHFSNVLRSLHGVSGGGIGGTGIGTPTPTPSTGGSKTGLPGDATGTPGMSPQQYQTAEDSETFGGHYDPNGVNFGKNPDGSKSQYGTQPNTSLPGTGSGSSSSGGADSSWFGGGGSSSGDSGWGSGGDSGWGSSSGGGVGGSAGGDKSPVGINPNTPANTHDDRPGGFNQEWGKGPDPNAPPSYTQSGQDTTPITPGGYGPGGQTGHFTDGQGWEPGTTASLHYAEDVLQQLRDLDPPDDDLGHMDERNDHVRDLMDKAHDEGYGASQFVADLHYATPNQQDKLPTDGDGNFMGQSSPNWADQPFSGSGPNPKDWYTDSAGYVKENEDPHVEKNWVDDLGGEDIIKYNDSRSKPQQGPRSAANGWGPQPAPPAPGPSPLDPGASGSTTVPGYTSPTDEINAGQQDKDNPGLGMVESELGGHFSSRDHYAEILNDAADFAGDPGGSADQSPNPGLGGGTLDTPDEGMSDGGSGGLTAHLHYVGEAGKSDSGYFNPNNATPQDWQAGSGEDFANQAEQSSDEVSNAMNPASDLTGGGDEGGGAEGGAAGGEAGLAEEAPLLLANLHPPAGGGFSLEAFDRGEFDASAVGDSSGELRHAKRVGGGPRSQVRIDPGFRQDPKARQAAQSAPPEDFGYDGGHDENYYTAQTNDPSGADIVASFHRSGAADVIRMGNQSNNARPGSSDDFSSSPMVQSFLRTAGRVYRDDEQRVLEGEFHPEGARNLPDDNDLAGTHYVM